MRSLRTLAPGLLAAVVLALLALGTAVELPGEEAAKDALGLGGAPACEPGRPKLGGAWRRERPMSSLRDEPRAGRVGTGVILVGGLEPAGRDDVRSVATVERFDLETGRYTRLPRLPARLNHLGVATHQGELYVAGGFGRLEPLTVTGRTWRYRPAKRAWTELASMPTARGAHGVAFLRGDLYAAGGANRRGSTATVERYDLDTGRWSKVAPLTVAREHLALATHDGHLYAAGGRDLGEALAVVERYDPETDRWSRVADLPRATSGIDLINVSGGLVAAGGEHPAKAEVYDDTWAYDPGADRWSSLPDMPVENHGYASAAFMGRLYLFGGSLCPGFEPTRGVYSLRIPR